MRRQPSEKGLCRWLRCSTDGPGTSQCHGGLCPSGICPTASSGLVVYFAVGPRAVAVLAAVGVALFCRKGSRDDLLPR